MAEAKLNPFVQYFKGARSELSHIVWPTRKEATRLTLLVIGASGGIGLVLALFDFGLNKGLEYLLSLR
ncbi:preprotein translocase subunit SecE [Candidatus Uhrbacteria bacterium]|nr:preprotein translocase subunit SecE [Candidatus Uhrbacteria bacterium]